MIKNNYELQNHSNDIAVEVLNEKIHRKSITLLKNNNDLIPFKSLDTLSIASLSIEVILIRLSNFVVFKN